MDDDRKRNAFIENLYREHYMDLKRYGYHFFHHDPNSIPYVEDCIQDTFAKAMDNYEKLLNHKNVIGWLFKTFRNELCGCMRKYAKYRKHCVSLPMDIADASDDLERWINRQDAADSIQRVYDALSPLEQSIFEDYYVHDGSLEETSKKQGITKNAVHCGAKRIRKKAESIIKKNSIFFLFLTTTFIFFCIV